MRTICKLLCIILLITLLCSCDQVVNDERTLKEALPEPFSLWVGAEERVNKDKVSRDPVVFDIDSKSELEALIQEYKLGIPKGDYDFNKTFFKKNKLYLVIRDGVSSQSYGWLNSLTVENNKLHVSLYSYLTSCADSGTHGFIIATDRESVKGVKDIKNISVEYLVPPEQATQ